MKLILMLFFPILNYSLVFATSVLLELDKFITETIITDSSLSPSEEYLYISLENGQTLILALNITKEKITQEPISIINTSIRNNLSFALPDDNYLILVGNTMLDSKIQILNIVDVSDKYNPKNVSTFNLNDTSIQSMNFLPYTKILVLIDKFNGILLHEFGY